MSILRDVASVDTSTASDLVVSTTGTDRLVVAQNGKVVLGGAGPPRATFDVVATDAIRIPNGTTAQRPATPAAGMIRWNTTTGKAELYDGSAWIEMTGSSVTTIHAGYVTSFTVTNQVTVDVVGLAKYDAVTLVLEEILSPAATTPRLQVYLMFGGVPNTSGNYAMLRDGRNFGNQQERATLPPNAERGWGDPTGLVDKGITLHSANYSHRIYTIINAGRWDSSFPAMLLHGGGMYWNDNTAERGGIYHVWGYMGVTGVFDGMRFTVNTDQIAQARVTMYAWELG